MKTVILLLISLCLALTLQAQVTKTVELTAGSLNTVLTTEELSTVTHLTLTGTMDARDFKTLRDSMPSLAVLQISEVSVAAYYGPGGTDYHFDTFYPANGIPNLAFYNIDKQTANEVLTAVALPSTITAIGESAFLYCINLTTVSIPSSVTTLGSNAFSECVRLGDQNLHAGLINIETGAFRGSAGLITVDAGNPNYTSQEGVLFNKDMSTLLHSPVTKAGSYTVPSTVNALEEGAFWGCKALESITLPGTLTNIGHWAFKGCSALSSLRVNSPFPVDLANVRDVFQDVNNLNVILHVPYGAKASYEAADQWNLFKTIVEAPNGFILAANTLRVTSGGEGGAAIQLRSNVDWTATADLPWGSFTPTGGTGDQTITFTFEPNLSDLSRSAEITFTSPGLDPQILTVVQAGQTKTIPITPGGLLAALTAAELNQITHLALSGTMDARDFKTLRDTLPHLMELDLTSVNIVSYTGPDGPGGNYNYFYEENKIPMYAFFNNFSNKGKHGLEKVILPNSVITIQSYAFRGCKDLAAIHIPNHVENIGSGAFENCRNLVMVTIPASVRQIEYDAFLNCGAMIQVDAANPNYSSQEGVLFDKGKSVLLHCPVVKTGDYTIPSTVTHVGYAAFVGCDRLTSVFIPASIDYLDKYTFNYCSALFVVEDDNPSYSSQDGILFNKDKSWLIGYPPSKGGELVIPPTVTTIGQLAFSACKNLTAVTIPASVSWIGSNAFADCTALQSITVDSPYPIDLSESYSVFDGLNPLICPLYVPYGAARNYAAAEEWSSFTNIIEKPSGFILTSRFLNMPAEGGINTLVTIHANVEWTALSNQEWLTVSPLSGNGNASLSFTAAPNESAVSRSAEVTFSAGDLTQTMIIHQTGIPKTVEITAGGLLSSLTAEELNGITHLIVTGTINAHDFAIMRDQMPELAVLDMSNASIAAYSGKNGTVPYDVSYAENELPQYAFYNMETYMGKNKLRSVLLPAALQSIGGNAFMGCHGLTSILLPPTVTFIGGAAFAGCTGLVSIQVKNPIPVNLEANSSVFSEVNPDRCTLTVPYGSKPLYAAADQWRDFVHIVEVPDGFHLSTNHLTLGAEEASSSTLEITANKAWTAISDESWLTINPTAATGNQVLTLTAAANLLVTQRTATVTVSAEGEDSQVIMVYQSGQLKTVEVEAGILSEAFTSDERNGITHLRITGSIDARDFKFLRDEMPLLSYLDLSDATVAAYSGSEGTMGELSTEYAANEVPGWAFLNNNTGKGKTSLTFVSLPSAIHSIGSSAFNNCINLTSISIPSSVSYIGGLAFYGCANLTSLELPSSLLSIENSTFFGCSSLTAITIPSLITTIGADAFYSCTSLASVILPPSLTTIGNDAFYNCISLASVELSSSLTTIGHSAFASCTALTSMPIPSSVTFIGINAFADCSSLSSVILPPSLTAIHDGTFNDCLSLVSINIPAMVTSIGNFAFDGCHNLTTIEMPALIATIGELAFANCIRLTSIHLPLSVVSIGSSAFRLCVGLTSIIAQSPYPVDLSNSQYVFSGIDKNTCILKVPYLTRERYATAHQWKDFKTIQEETEGFTVDAINLRLPAEGGTSVVNIAANVAWTVASDQQWLTVDPASGSGDHALTFTAQANSTAAERKAIVTVSATGFSSQTLTLTQGGLPKTIDLTAGGLRSALTAEELNGITHLTITGTIDVRDFKVLRDEMPLLAELDMSRATIAAYTGTEGTNPYNTQYRADEVPAMAFNDPDLYIGKISLTAVLLPISLRSVAVNAFYGCTGLTTITIPSSVTSIEGGAFFNCRSLTSIYANATVPVDLSASFSVFDGINKASCTLNVPTGSLALYKAAYQWQDFINIVEGPVGIKDGMESIYQIQCYPNPFNQQITIEIQNPTHEKMAVDIYNMAGQRVKNLTNGNTSGQLSLTWDGSNEQGRPVVPGVYLLKVNGQIVKLVKW